MRPGFKSLTGAVLVIHSIAIHFHFSGLRLLLLFRHVFYILAPNPITSPFTATLSGPTTLDLSADPTIRHPKVSIYPSASLYPPKTFSSAQYLPPPQHSLRYSLHPDTLLAYLALLVEILEEATQSHWRANLDQLTISSL